jgi:hypothetical protein
MALSSLQLIARTSEVLEQNGYRRVTVPNDWPSASRLFEDPYGIVGVHVYETWRELAEEWTWAQSLMVDLISATIARPEPKTWEGYLVLLTGADVLDDDHQVLVDLRYNTNRLRKLVATGQDIETLDDVRNVLLPLLPLDVPRSESSEAGLLARLADLLEEDGIDRRATETAVDAFIRNQSIMERLHALRGEP